MKSNQQNSQAQAVKPVIKPVKVEVVDDAEDDYLDDEDEETPELEKPLLKKTEEIVNKEKDILQEQQVAKEDPQLVAEQQIAMEIELLQNNGRYRVELLHQLQEINKALVVIAGTLVDLAGKNDKS